MDSKGVVGRRPLAGGDRLGWKKRREGFSYSFFYFLFCFFFMGSPRGRRSDNGRGAQLSAELLAGGKPLGRGPGATAIPEQISPARGGVAFWSWNPVGNYGHPHQIRTICTDTGIFSWRYLDEDRRGRRTSSGQILAALAPNAAFPDEAKRRFSGEFVYFAKKSNHPSRPFPHQSANLRFAGEGGSRDARFLLPRPCGQAIALGSPTSLLRHSRASGKFQGRVPGLGGALGFPRASVVKKCRIADFVKFTFRGN